MSGPVFDVIVKMTAYGSSLSARTASDKAPLLVEAAPIPASLVAVLGLWLGATGDDSQAAYGLLQALGGFVVICLVVFVAGGGLGWAIAGRPVTGGAIWLVRLFGFSLILAGWADLHDREAAGGSGAVFVAAVSAWGIGSSLLSTLILGRTRSVTRTSARPVRSPELEARRRIWMAAAVETIPVGAAAIATATGLFVGNASIGESVLGVAFAIMAFVVFLACVPLYFASGGGWLLLRQSRVGLAIGVGRALLLSALGLVFLWMSTRECIDCGNGPTDAQLWGALAVTTAIPLISAAALLLTQSGRPDAPSHSGLRVTVGR